MKKIIFVEKEDPNYDPVAAFFNKKPPSMNKISSQTAKPPTNKNSNQKKVSIITEKPMQKVKRNEQITPKIGKKGEYNPPNSISNNTRAGSTKHQKGKTQSTIKQSVQRSTKTNIHSEDIVNILGNHTISHNEKSQIRQDSIEKIKALEVIHPVKRQNKIIQQGKLQAFNKKIKQLESRQEQYIRRIAELEQKQQKFVKNEQKLLKTQKDLKVASQKSKESDSMAQKLKEKQIQIKQLLNSSTIPYNHKREIILNNKIKQLKRLNRQLVLKLKNYKGSELLEAAMQQNRQEITKELYTVEVQQQLKQQMNIQIQTLLSQLINKINSYVQLRIKQKGQKLAWNVENKFIAEIVGMSQIISLNYLNYYDICPLPKSNEEAVSIYSILEEYKQRNCFNKIIDRFHLNYELTKQNLQIVNSISSGKNELIQLKSDITKNRKKKDDKVKIQDYLNILQKRSNFNEILVIQNICQLQLLKEWMAKTIGQISEEISSISKTISQIRDIVQLGQSGKESLYYYLSTNISHLQTKFPSLKMQLKQMNLHYNQIQRYNIQ